MDHATVYSANLKASMNLVKQLQPSGSIPPTTVFALHPSDVLLLLANRKNTEAALPEVSERVTALLNANYIVTGLEGEMYWMGHKIILDEAVLPGSIAFINIKYAETFTKPRSKEEALSAPVSKTISVQLASAALLIQFGLFSFFYLITMPAISKEAAALLTFLSIAAIIISLRVTTFNPFRRKNVKQIHGSDQAAD